MMNQNEIDNLIDKVKSLFSDQQLREIYPFGRNRLPLLDPLRRLLALKVRTEAAFIAFNRQHPEHQNNGEENDYRGTDNKPNYIANYSKGLRRKNYRDPDPKKNLGEVDAEAYQSMLNALNSGNPDDFEQIQLGTAPQNGGRKLINPQAGLAFDLEGPDAQAVTTRIENGKPASIRPAPRIDSAENSAEMGELYWMALLRDVNFTEYDSNSMVAEAADDMSKFTDFRGPKVNGRVTAGTIFRGFAEGDLVGPYLSQFLLKGNRDIDAKEDDGSENKGLIRYGSLRIDQRQRTVMPNIDYMTNYDRWLEVQNGFDTSGQDKFDPTPRFIRNMRDLANYVHFDELYEAYLNACLILLNINAPLAPSPFDSGNPYIKSMTQNGFGTFGGPHILSLVTEVATRALKAVWFQKWFVHRRLRPEEFGGRIHNHLMGYANYPQINKEILNSSVLKKIREHNKTKFGDDTYLLPQAFPEGSPTHPAYGAGHATVAGACVTVLKAWFDENAIVANPMVPNKKDDPLTPGKEEGTVLVPYTPKPGEASLTVGCELDKLAANIAIGRNGGGVHWRTDYTESVKLGEVIAIGILQEQSITYNEDIKGMASFTLTKLDGTKIKIEDGQVKPA